MVEMRKAEYIYQIKEDFFRYRDKWSLWNFVCLYFRFDTFAIIFLYRTLQYLKGGLLSGWVKYLYLKKRRQTGIQIPLNTKIGEGMLFCHFSCIVFSEQVVVGKYCSIHQGVTVGRVFAGDKAGTPTLGDHVIIYPGAKVVGNIHVGNNVMIGANATVLNDVPDNCVVVGSPARIVSTDSRKAIGPEWKHFFALDKGLKDEKY